MDFSLSALEIKEKKAVLFSGKSSQSKTLIELILKNQAKKENILVVFDPANYSPLMNSFFVISKKVFGKHSFVFDDYSSLPEISSLVHSIEGKKSSKGILLFDSLSSLLSFNPSNAVYSFLFFETRKAKELNYSVVCFVDERLHDNAVLNNIKKIMDYNFFFEVKEKKLFIEQTAFPFNSITKNFVFDL
ncbi:hypothetical protein KKG83_05660 [Candidatus Micrarchaeota archaeon]|nr:hypothetical protein [Candidatus Micrarchaeota archaeon]